MIILENVNSTNVKMAGYNKETKDLYIKFNNGEYVYHNVPEEVYNAFKLADSKGRFIAAEVARKFDYEKINFLEKNNLQMPEKGL